MGVGVDKESSILIALLKDAVGDASNHIDNRKSKLDETALKLCSDAVDAILPHCNPMGIPEVTGACAAAWGVFSAAMFDPSRERESGRLPIAPISFCIECCQKKSNTRSIPLLSLSLSLAHGGVVGGIESPTAAVM
jgi:hypothetical protein